MPTSNAGLTLIEILVVCVVIVVLLLLGLSIWERNEEERLQARAIAAPGSVFELSVTSEQMEAVEGMPFFIEVTIQNPTRYDLNFVWIAADKFIFQSPGQVIPLIEDPETTRSFTIDETHHWTIEDEENEAAGIQIFSSARTANIPGKGSIKIRFSATFPEPATHVGTVRMDKLADVPPNRLPDGEFMAEDRQSPLVSQPIHISVQEYPDVN